jgi:hypothetical protein
MTSVVPGQPAPDVDPENWPGARLQLVHDDLMAEYSALNDLVSGFDQRLLTIKGWGVTLGLASLGLGFQQEHYGLFLVAALSGLAFWILEATTKAHQMRLYPRLRDIECTAYELFRIDTPGGPVSAPLINWSWYTGGTRVTRRPTARDPRVPEPWPTIPAPAGAMDRQGSVPKRIRLEGVKRLRRSPFVFPHVVLPHGLTIAAGGILFALAALGSLGDITHI